MGTSLHQKKNLHIVLFKALTMTNEKINNLMFLMELLSSMYDTCLLLLSLYDGCLGQRRLFVGIKFYYELNRSILSTMCQDGT